MKDAVPADPHYSDALVAKVGEANVLVYLTDDKNIFISNISTESCIAYLQL
jgi:hypothetical protein